MDLCFWRNFLLKVRLRYLSLISVCFHLLMSQKRLKLGLKLVFRFFIIHTLYKISFRLKFSKIRFLFSPRSYRLCSYELMTAGETNQAESNVYSFSHILVGFGMFRSDGLRVGREYKCYDCVSKVFPFTKLTPGLLERKNESVS